MASVVVEAGENFKITLPSEVSQIFSVSAGERLYMIASEDLLVIRKIPKDIPEALANIIGELTFNRRAKKRAEKWLLGHMKASFNRV